MSFPHRLFSRPNVMLAILALSSLFLRAHVNAQEGSLEPTDLWYSGYRLVLAAEEKQESGDYEGALTDLDQAKLHFDYLVEKFPQFQAEMVRERGYLIAEQQDEIKKLMHPEMGAGLSLPKPILKVVLTILLVGLALGGWAYGLHWRRIALAGSFTKGE